MCDSCDDDYMETQYEEELINRNRIFMAYQIDYGLFQIKNQNE